MNAHARITWVGTTCVFYLHVLNILNVSRNCVLHIDMLIYILQVNDMRFRAKNSSVGRQLWPTCMQALLSS